MASERLSLLIESQTKGTQEVARLEEALNKVLAKAESSGKKAEDAINKQGASLRGFRSSVDEAISNPLQFATKSADSFLSKFGTMGVAISATGAAAVAAGVGLFTLAKSAGNLAEQYSNNAIRLGLTVREYSLFSTAAENAGLSGDSLVGTIRGLSKSLSESSTEGAKGKRALREIGVEASNAFGGVKPFSVLLLEIADGLGDIQNPAERAEKAIAILGRSGVENLPLLTRELRGSIAELEKMGAAFEDVAANKAKAFDKSIDDLKTNLKSFARDLGVAAAEVFQLLLPGTFDKGGQAAAAQKKYFDDLRKRGEAAARDAAIVRSGGILPFPFKPGADIKAVHSSLGISGGGTPSIEDLQAVSTLTRKQGIQAFLEGRDSQLVLQKEKKALEEAIEANDLEGVKRAERRVKLAEAQIASEQKIKAINEKFSTFIVQDKENPFRGRSPSLFRGAARSAQNLPEFQISGSDISAANAGAAAANLAQGRARLEGDEAKRTATRTNLIEMSRRDTEFQARKVELLSGPGGEFDAVQKITALRLESLRAQLDLGVEARDIEQERIQVVRDGELQIMALQKQRLQENREAAGKIFDALVAGGAGIKQFITGQALVIGRSVFQNISQEIFKGTTGKFSLPGQTGADGKPNLLGRALQGTPFGIDPLKAATDLNTLATQQNTAALLQVGLGGSASRILSGAVGAGGMIFNANEPRTHMAIGGGPGPAPGGKWNTASLLGAGGAIAGGTFGAIAGVRQGGLAGGLTTAGSVVATASALLPMISKSLAFLGPIGMAAGLGLGVATAFLPDPKKKRERELDESINAARFEERIGTSYFSDVSGSMVDYNRRGDVRTFITVNIPVNAMDSRSFIDRKDDIAEAVRQSLQQGHELIQEVRFSAGTAVAA